MDMNATDAQLAHLIDMKAWWEQTHAPDLRDQLIKAVRAFRAEREIHQKFLESLEREMEQGYPRAALQSARSGSQMIPVRNVGMDIPGHITCFREHNGLIHGGIRYASNYVLVCRAFRLEYRSMDCHQDQEYQVAVVAGVCEQKTPSGQIMSAWSTARRLQQYYSSTSTLLPTSSFKCIGDGELIGHYMPAGGEEAFWQKVFEIGESANVVGWEIADSGVLDLTPELSNQTVSPYDGRPVLNMWANCPLYDTAIENPLCNPQTACTEAYPICTPYIKVFAPDPDINETVVWMIGAYREMYCKSSFRQVISYDRQAQWYCKTFF